MLTSSENPVELIRQFRRRLIFSRHHPRYRAQREQYPTIYLLCPGHPFRHSPGDFSRERIQKHYCAFVDAKVLAESRQRYFGVLIEHIDVAAREFLVQLPEQFKTLGILFNKD